MPWVNQVGERYLTPKVLLGFFVATALVLHAIYVWKSLSNQAAGLENQERMFVELKASNDLIIKATESCGGARPQRYQHAAAWERRLGLEAFIMHANAE
jgi:hypothetical protein